MDGDIHDWAEDAVGVVTKEDWPTILPTEIVVVAEIARRSIRLGRSPNKPCVLDGERTWLLQLFLSMVPPFDKAGDLGINGKESRDNIRFCALCLGAGGRSTNGEEHPVQTGAGGINDLLLVKTDDASDNAGTKMACGGFVACCASSSSCNWALLGKRLLESSDKEEQDDFVSASTSFSMLSTAVDDSSIIAQVVRF